MTRIILILNPDLQATYITSDPRSPRAVMAAINSRQLQVGPPEIDLNGARQWAMLHSAFNLVVVVNLPPPVQLSPRLFDILFCLRRGLKGPQIAAELGLSMRMVYSNVHDLRERFGEFEIPKILARAVEYGFLDEEAD